MGQNTLENTRSVDLETQLSPILSATQIGRNFQDRWIWQDLSFDLFPCDRLAIVGPSGAGKSLLLKALAGLEPIQSGQISFQGKPLSHLKMPQFRSQVIYLHQQPALLEGTVESNLKRIYQFTIHRHKTYHQPKILEYLASLGRSAKFLQRATEELSGGERQIVTCLRALQLAPQVLLLDEPTASLDSTATEQIETLIAQWQQADAPKACIWTSHDPGQLARVSNRQIHLEHP